MDSYEECEGSYIDYFQDDWEKESDIIVTIDGPSASGKGTVGRYIANQLDIEHFSASDVFYQIAEERGMEDHELSEKAEKKVDLAVDKGTLERALKQSCVVDSRIAGWVLGNYADLKIHLTADLDERAKRLAEREGLEEQEAKEIVSKRDREDYRRYNEYYGINREDQEIYDETIDNTDLTIEQQNQKIDQILEKRFPEKIK